MPRPSPVITTRLLRAHESEDFASLVALFAEVFEHESRTPPAPAKLGSTLANPRFMAMVAVLDSRIIGGLTAHLLDDYYTGGRQAYLYDIAVDPAFQRHGVGRALMQDFTAHCTEAGFAEIFVQADREDAHALDFYRATGAGREAAVVHFTYALARKNLREDVLPGAA